MNFGKTTFNLKLSLNNFAAVIQLGSLQNLENEAIKLIASRVLHKIPSEGYAMVSALAKRCIAKQFADVSNRDACEFDDSRKFA